MADKARLIYGSAGTGKTEEIIRIAVNVSQKSEVIIIVPEQFSFEIERKLMLQGIKGGSNVEVLSFERLCENIFRQLGGIAIDVLDNTAKLMMIFTAIYDVLPELTVYRRISGSESGMLSCIDDMKRYGVTTERLGEILSSGAIENEYLKSKLTDILKIYEYYEMLMCDKYCDPVDDILRAMQRNGIREFFSDKYVLVDGFYHFTPMQWEFLELMLSSASGFAITMLCDSLKASSYDVFTVTKQTAERFTDICKRNLIELSFVQLEVSHRLGTGTALELVGKVAAGQRPEPDENIAFDNVKIISAPNSWEEIRFIATEISHLCRKNGYCYGDFVVSARDIEDYKTKLDCIFKLYDIPLFYSASDRLAQRPFFSYIHTVASILVEGMRLELVLRLARNICSGVLEEDYFDLESYCYIWNLDGKAFRAEFTLPVDGLTENTSKFGKAKLDRLNRIRKKLIEPVLKLQDDVKNANGNSFVSAFYTLLVGGDNCVVQNIKRLVQSDDRQEYAEHFDTFVDILDTISRIVGDRVFSTVDMARLLILSIDNLEKNKIPNITDCVMVVNADSARVNSPKVVFVIGLNVGDFPEGVSTGGFFSASEHTIMANLGSPICPDNVHRAIMERLYLYIALTQGSERVYLCHERRTLTGDEHIPISILAQLASHGVEWINIDELSEGFFVTNTKTLSLAHSKSVNVAEKLILEEFSKAHGTDKIDSANTDGKVSTGTIVDILGTQLRLSHTGIQTFFECPYKYFLNYILHISKRQRVEDTHAMISGSARHSVLEHIFSSEEIWSSLKSVANYVELYEKIDNELVGYIHRCTGGASLSPRLTYAIRRLASGLARFVELQIRMSKDSVFYPAFTEAEIDVNGSFSPILLNIPQANILVRGKVDRVDFANMDSRNFVRVIDYKSSAKKLDSKDIANGLNMQLLIYLSAICSDTLSIKNRLMPVGVAYSTLYHKPKEHIGSISQDEKEKYIDEALSGTAIYLDIPSITDTADEIRRDSSINRLNEANFAELFGNVYRNICRMSSGVYGGDFAPKCSKDVCMYCDIKAICKQYMNELS